LLKRVGEKRMAYVNYMEVGKTVLIAGIGATTAGAIHFMWLQPYFAGQMLGPVKVSAAVDWIIAFIAGLATTMYTDRWDLTRIFGFAATAFFAGIGLLDQFNLLTGGGTTTTATMTTTPVASSLVPRASYLAPAGVIVNKHGSVPEVAAGTFG
jgi:hypothetical protein